MIHDTNCPRSGGWYVRRECREFSTDGTALGADIAHQMGTDAEADITQQGLSPMSVRLTGMEEEQAEWEA